MTSYPAPKSPHRRSGSSESHGNNHPSRKRRTSSAKSKPSSSTPRSNSAEPPSPRHRSSPSPGAGRPSNSNIHHHDAEYDNNHHHHHHRRHSRQSSGKSRSRSPTKATSRSGSRSKPGYRSKSPEKTRRGSGGEHQRRSKSPEKARRGSEGEHHRRSKSPEKTRRGSGGEHRHRKQQEYVKPEKMEVGNRATVDDALHEPQHRRPQSNLMVSPSKRAPVSLQHPYDSKPPATPGRQHALLEDSFRKADDEESYQYEPPKPSKPPTPIAMPTVMMDITDTVGLDLSLSNRMEHRRVDAAARPQSLLAPVSPPNAVTAAAPSSPTPVSPTRARKQTRVQSTRSQLHGDNGAMKWCIHIDTPGGHAIEPIHIVRGILAYDSEEEDEIERRNEGKKQASEVTGWRSNKSNNLAENAIFKSPKPSQNAATSVRSSDSSPQKPERHNSGISAAMAQGNHSSPGQQSPASSPFKVSSSMSGRDMSESGSNSRSLGTCDDTLHDSAELPLSKIDDPNLGMSQTWDAAQDFSGGSDEEDDSSRQRRLRSSKNRAVAVVDLNSRSGSTASEKIREALLNQSDSSEDEEDDDILDSVHGYITNTGYKIGRRDRGKNRPRRRVEEAEEEEESIDPMAGFKSHADPPGQEADSYIDSLADIEDSFAYDHDSEYGDADPGGSRSLEGGVAANSSLSDRPQHQSRDLKRPSRVSSGKAPFASRSDYGKSLSFLPEDEQLSTEFSQKVDVREVDRTTTPSGSALRRPSGDPRSSGHITASRSPAQTKSSKSHRSSSHKKPSKSKRPNSSSSRSKERVDSPGMNTSAPDLAVVAKDFFGVGKPPMGPTYHSAQETNKRPISSETEARLMASLNSMSSESSASYMKTANPYEMPDEIVEEQTTPFMQFNIAAEDGIQRVEKNEELLVEDSDADDGLSVKEFDANEMPPLTECGEPDEDADRWPTASGGSRRPPMRGLTKMRSLRKGMSFSAKRKDPSTNSIKKKFMAFANASLSNFGNASSGSLLDDGEDFMED